MSEARAPHELATDSAFWAIIDRMSVQEPSFLEVRHVRLIFCTCVLLAVVAAVPLVLLGQWPLALGALVLAPVLALAVTAAIERVIGR